MHEPVGCKWLGNKVISAILNGLHGHRNIAMTGDQDDWQFGINCLDPCEKLETINLRHAYIGNDNAVISSCNAVQGIKGV